MKLCDDGARLKASYEAAWEAARRGEPFRSHIAKARNDWMKHANRCHQCRAAEWEAK